MSREIKFRAWNSVTKEMEQVTQINLKNHYVQTTFNKIGYSYGQPDDVIVEQFTGLKDKNGKDVYEGDLLKIKYPFSDNDEICEVKWSNSDAGFIIGNFQFWKVVPKSVVVGNVHEDKDLLEAEK